MRSPGRRVSLFAALLLFPFWPVAQAAPTFSQVVVFGDSLSDDGNIRHLAEKDFLVLYPGQLFDYSDGRFTNSSDTFPPSAT